MGARRGEAAPVGRFLCAGECPLPRPTPLLVEALRGKEWDMLQLWVQAALDPLAFPSPRRSGDRHRRLRPSRQGRAGGGSSSGAGGASEPSDIVRKRFEDFTRCLSTAFAPGVSAGYGSDGGGGGGAGGGGGSYGGYGGGRDGKAWKRTQAVDTDVGGAFEKRLSRFEQAQLASLSRDEVKVRCFARA